MNLLCKIALTGAVAAVLAAPQCVAEAAARAVAFYVDPDGAVMFPEE